MEEEDDSLGLGSDSGGFNPALDNELEPGRHVEVVDNKNNRGDVEMHH